MAIKDELGKRMKNYYEATTKTKLIRRMPVAIRIDGKAFHTFTRGLKKPFDEILIKTMSDTTKYLCENIMGTVLGYTQSDEITLILTDYQKLSSAAWFDYEVLKICSVSASMATMAFNKFFIENVNVADIDDKDFEIYSSKFYNAMFDSRCFNIPKEEVANLIYWRQVDAQRNSVQMLGQSFFSHKQLQNKSCEQIQEMLFSTAGINWSKQPAKYKRGVAVVKEIISPSASAGGKTARAKWVIDNEMPLIKDEGRKYVEDRIYFKEVL